MYPRAHGVAIYIDKACIWYITLACQALEAGVSQGKEEERGENAAANSYGIYES
jgi:hypothetical protein